MNFLVPLYLLGALAVGVPIYLHLRRKPPKDAVEFGSLMFLQSTEYPPVKRSRRLENVPLLLLRCLALLLLAGLFARPFLSGSDQDREEAAKRTVLLIDTSASMRRAGLWEKAHAEAVKVLGEADARDPLAIVAVDGAVRTVVDFKAWQEAVPGRRKELAEQALDGLEPSWQGTDLGRGLLAAADLLADAAADEDSARDGRIVVISDLQESAGLEPVAGATWPDGLRVELRAIEADGPTNATLAVAPTADPGRPMVRVGNDESSERQEFTLRIGDREVPAVVPAGESRVFEVPADATGVVLAGDGQDFDNRLFLSPRVATPVTLGFLGESAADDADGSDYYFRRAFGRSGLMEPRFVDDLGEAPAILAVARPLDGAEIQAVRGHLEKGGRVLLVLASSGMAGTLGQLAGLEKPPGLEEAGGRYALLEGIDFDHPLLAGFRDPRWRDFTDVHFWHHRKLDAAALPGARVMARFDNGDPAWLDVPVGRGGLVVMTSGWQPHDSQLALSSKFVPLLYSIFAGQGPRIGEARQFFTGDTLPVKAADRRVVLPGGAVRELAEDEVLVADEPGIYRLEGGTQARRYAVNLRPSESVLRPLDPSALEALGVPLAAAPGDAVAAGEMGKRRLRAREAEEAQDLWRWAALGLLMLLIIESAVAARGSNAKAPMEGVPT
ncbi:BatA domain-containing protein [Luteolibacter marinus]|uniref:BatA domain-containing protein n=1 Tax=Luteolibacter marinus TaxID=2776705 RepID=UPI0018680E7C|nr:VWA domain-containing protein [Luteolibacter marinus]